MRIFPTVNYSLGLTGCAFVVALGAIAVPPLAVMAREKSLKEELVIFRKLVPKMDETPSPVLKGGVSQSEMAQVKAAAIAAPPVNIFGFALKAGNDTTRVTYVNPYSAAWQGGLKAGDEILKAKTYHEGKKAALLVGRGGKQYTCLLALAAPTLETSWKSSGKLTGSATKTPAQTLADYSIAMVVDNSASMGTKDCAGGISRWQWCHDHISELYKEDNGVLQRNISIVTFDNNFQSRQNCSPSELKSVFENRSPAGETNMAPALEEAFSLVRRQISYNKPAIVTVVSDGRPTDVDKVKATLIKEINGLSDPQLLSIVFIEVGLPDKYLQELDNDLVKQGAKADVIKVIPFSAASAQGLSETLSAAVPKTALKATVTAQGAAQAAKGGPNEAKAAYNSHVYTPPATPEVQHAAAQQHATPSVVHAPPPIKAHPAGVPTTAAAPAEVKPVEVDEKADAVRNSANKTYK
jgi:uncharacterized protein YegL